MLRFVASPSAATRLRAAREFVLARPAATEILLLGATREAADDFVRELAAERGATFGLHRFSPLQLAASLAAAEVARLGLAPATGLGSEALAARAAAELAGHGGLGYFAPVQRFPGFPRALAATLGELRAAGIEPAALAAVPAPGADVGRLLAEYERQLQAAAVADHAELLRLAIEALRRPNRFAGMPLVLLDVPAEPGLDRDFIRQLLAGAGETLVTAPAGDQHVRTLLGDDAQEETPAAATREGGEDSLRQLQRFLFADEKPPRRDADDSVRFFSAPGEARECIEIARAILDEARAGVAFDRMAIFLRTPPGYAPLLETAFRRAGIPAYFARGTSRPDAAGRAFLALLACKEEGLSASRFAEYLSLGEVPRDSSPAAEVDAVEPAAAGLGDDEQAANVRAPWKWEELLVDAAVIGGRERWQRRLRGLEASLQLRLAEETTEEADSPRAAGFRRDLENLAGLRAFALPAIDCIDALPLEARWCDWLPALRGLAQSTLRRPARVLGVLEELEPMGEVGPVSIAEVGRVLSDRLSTLEEDPPPSRYGRVFVAPVTQARGRSFAVVFAPGLAERIFPQRPREDPLLLDGLRERLSRELRTQLGRGLEERLLLRLAIGAAEKRVYLSYPRVDVGEARPRVPSFYGLDVVRATRGEIPDFEQLERVAAAAVQARLAWPAPVDPRRAIDAIEHDLAVLEPLLHGSDLAAAKGRAKYLLELNPWLAQSLRTRYARWQRREWRKQDGLVLPNEEVRHALAEHRLRARPYSATALQRFAACPYQFLLAAIYRFQPREEPAPLEQLDPLTRGSLFHRVQADVLRRLQARAAAAGAVPAAAPLFGIALSAAAAELDAVLARVVEEYRDLLAPPIARVWEDEIQAVRADLHTWLRRMADSDGTWRPLRFELAFGLPKDDEHDPASLTDAVQLAGGWLLRGSVDLVEESRDGSTFRITDYKTGKDPGKVLFAVGGGEVLQPVLYALAVEAAMQKRVVESRLWYCTTRGGFREYPVPLTDAARRQGAKVMEIIDRAIETGMLPPAPREKACDWCDFRPVCGPYEERRARQFKDVLPELQQLREMQ